MTYFLKAAELEHVGKAALSIPVSASAISNAISNLERELGYPLFKRQNRRIFLTPEGEVLKVKIQSILNSIDQLSQNPSIERSDIQGNFRLAGGHYLCDKLLTKSLSELQDHHPGLTVEVFSMNPGAVVDSIDKGITSFGLCISPKREENTYEQVIHEGKLHIAIRKGHPILKKAKKKQVLELSKYPASIYLSTNGLNTCNNHPELQRFGILPKVVFQYDSDDVGVQKLKSSDCWSLMPDYVIKGHKNKITTIHHPLDWKASYRLSIIMNKTQKNNHFFYQLSKEIQKQAELWLNTL